MEGQRRGEAPREVKEARPESSPSAIALEILKSRDLQDPSARKEAFNTLYDARRAYIELFNALQSSMALEEKLKYMKEEDPEGVRAAYENAFSKFQQFKSETLKAIKEFDEAVLAALPDEHHMAWSDEVNASSQSLNVDWSKTNDTALQAWFERQRN